MDANEDTKLLCRYRYTNMMQKPLLLESNFNNMSIIGISGLPGKIQGNMPSNNEKNSKDDSSFNDILTKSLKEVNSAQIKSINAFNSLVAGKTEIIHETMIQMQKASISFQMMMEVRNKLVDAYNEIIKMRS